MATGLPTSSVIEVRLNGIWTDISAFVKQSNGNVIRQTQGRVSAVDDSQPGSLTFTLDGVDGRFVPDAPTIVSYATGSAVLSANPYYPYFVEDTQVRWTVTKGAAVVLFNGWITDIVPTLASEPTQSIVTVTATDSLGRLNRGQLRTQLAQEILLDTPTAYWPLNEANGSHAGLDASGNFNVPPLIPFNNAIGSTDTNVWGVTGLGIEAETAVQIQTASAPWLLRARNVVSTTGFIGFTYECWIRIDSSINPSPDLVSFGNLDGTNTITMYANNIDYTVSVYITQLGAVTFPAGASPPINDGKWHHLAVAVQGGVQNAYVDGVAFYTTAAGTSVLNVTDMFVGGSFNGTGMRGSACNAALYGTKLSGARILAHYQAGVTRPTGATVATQAAELVAYVGGSATYEAGYGPQVSCPLVTSGKSPLANMLTNVRGEGGLLWDPGTGLTFRARSALHSATVAVTADMEDDLLGPPILLRSTINKVSSATAFSSAASSTATDPTVASGPVASPIETSLSDPTELYSVASRAVGSSLTKSTRISQVRVDLMTAKNDLYAAMLALRLGDRVRLSNASVYLGVTRVDGYALGWVLESSYDGFVYTFDLEPADSVELGFDTFRFASDGVSTTGVLTSAGTTEIITTPSGPTFSTTGGDYPADLNINGERATLGAAPGGGASPQTWAASVTRGVAPSLARAHAAGESVEVADAIRFAF